MGENWSNMLVIEGRLDGLNEYTKANRSNRYIGAQMKRDNEDVVRAYIRKQMKGEHYNYVYIVFNWHEKNKRRDLDNIAFAKKFILDALVKEGVLDDDGWNNVIGFEDIFYLSPNNPRIEVEIKEV